MLLRFGVENYMSIKKYQEISLAASSLKDVPDFILKNDRIKEGILPVISIYGANASGKSNILRAIRFMCGFVVNSHKNEPQEKEIFRYKFRLDPVFDNEPSQFDCDFFLNEVRYHFGFKLSTESVVEEWLYAYPSGSRQVWYHRNINEPVKFHFGKYLKGRNKTIEELTRHNSLFLSAAHQNNHEQLSSVYEYFKNNFVFKFNTNKISPIEITRYFENEAIKNKIMHFIRIADIGITDSKIDKINTPDDVKPFINELETLFKKFIDNDTNLTKVDTLTKVSFGHANVNGDTVYLDLASESRGTMSLISILGPTFEAIEKGNVIIIDELDTSMHSLLSRKLLELFSSSKINSGGAQVIFSTHDTNLLCNNVLRRDEIWFTEKDCEGATFLYPLTDIKTRNSDNLEKGYLQGRFGAIPFLGKTSDLFESGMEI